MNNSATKYLFMLFEGDISPSIFSKCDIPNYPDDDFKLCEAIRSLVFLEQEIGAVNLYQFTKDHKIVARYMGIVNEIDGRGI